MAMDWSFICEDTVERTVVAGCFIKSGQGQTYLQWLLSAWAHTLEVAISALLVALIVGSLMGVIRTLPDGRMAGPLRLFGNLWVDFFRGIPLLVQILIWYNVVPALLPMFANVPKLLLVVLGLGFFTSARIAEQVKAGIESIPRGQRYAGMALGFSTLQTYRYVLLPVAYRVIIPPLTSETMNILKNSSVAYAVSILELTFFAQQVAEETSRGVEVYLLVSGLYIVSALAMNRIMALVERRLRIPGVTATTTAGGH